MGHLHLAVRPPAVPSSCHPSIAMPMAIVFPTALAGRSWGDSDRVRSPPPDLSLWPGLRVPWLATVAPAGDWNGTESEACGCRGRTPKEGAHWWDWLQHISAALLTPSLALAVLSSRLHIFRIQVWGQSHFSIPIGTHLGLILRPSDARKIQAWCLSLSETPWAFSPREGDQGFIKALDIFFWTDKLLGPNNFHKWCNFSSGYLFRTWT